MKLNTLAAVALEVAVLTNGCNQQPAKSPEISNIELDEDDGEVVARLAATRSEILKCNDTEIKTWIPCDPNINKGNNSTGTWVCANKPFARDAGNLLCNNKE